MVGQQGTTTHFKSNLCTSRVVHTMSQYDGLECSLSSAMKALAADSNDRYAALESTFLPIQANSRDVAVLGTLKPRTKEDPYRYVGLKWAQFQASKQDIVLMEATGTGIQDNGKRYAYRILKSADFPEFVNPLMERTPVSFFVVKFVETEDPTRIDMKCSLNVLSEFQQTTIARLYNPQTCVEKYKAVLQGYHRRGIRIPRRASLSVVPALHEVTKKRPSSRCSHCQKTFGFGRQRYKSQECPHPICKACVKHHRCWGTISIDKLKRMNWQETYEALSVAVKQPRSKRPPQPKRIELLKPSLLRRLSRRCSSAAVTSTHYDEPEDVMMRSSCPQLVLY